MLFKKKHYQNVCTKSLKKYDISLEYNKQIVDN